MNELVSVIVPCYNVEDTVERCLRSIAAQTHENLEVLCVNDGSTDDTLAVLEAFAAGDDRFRAIDKPNGGYGAACNRGIDEAHGEWIAVIEPDDTVRAAMFEKMLAFATETADDASPVDLVKTPYWTVLPRSDTNAGHTIPCRYFGRVHPATQPFRIAEAPRLLKHRPSIWSALYRTDFLREHDIRFVEAPGAGWTDNPFLYDTLLRARIAYLDEAFYEYREEDPTKTTAFARSCPDQVIGRLNEMADIVDALGVTDPGVLGAHAKRTVNYLRILADAHGLGGGAAEEAVTEAADGATTGSAAGSAAWSPTQVRDAMVSVAHRLDPATVFAEPELPLRNKRLFANLTGAPLPRISPLPRLRARAAEATWALRYSR